MCYKPLVTLVGYRMCCVAGRLPVLDELSSLEWSSVLPCDNFHDKGVHSAEGLDAR